MNPSQTKLFTNQDIDEKVLIYNIRIVPPEPLYSQVINFKKEFIENYGEQLLARSTPHITLAKFVMSTSFQNLMVEHFSALGETKTFSLKASGFGVFESSGTLLLQINPSKELETLLKTISALKKAFLHHKAKNFGLIYTPSISIASMLDAKTLKDSLRHFKSIVYSQQPFEVDHLIITARENGKTWDWEHRINLS